MQAECFDSNNYDCLTDLTGNAKVTLMMNSRNNELIVRKVISAKNIGLYQQLSRVRHKNLVRILGVEETGTACYSYEEYIGGKTLAEVLADGPVSEEQAVIWIEQLCSAVELLHEQEPPIIHRDIKPGNILLTPDGLIKLIDFDAAKEFSSVKQMDTELIGTPTYAAPEQYGFAPSDTRTDIYAIGVLLHELLAGSKLYIGKAEYKKKYRRIVKNCTAIEPKKRYYSVRDLKRQLKGHGLARILGMISGYHRGVWWETLFVSALYIAAAAVLWHSVFFRPDASLALFAAFVIPFYVLITAPLLLWLKLPLLKSNRLLVRIAGVALCLLVWFAALWLLGYFIQ